jgi:hemoglobin
MAYGEGDASFQAAGGEAGLRRLVDDFYDIMDSLPQAARIRAMHPADLGVSRDKLARFLCGWLGGPNRFNEKYGPITIPGAHRHLDIREAERDAWLLCMKLAIDRRDWADDFKDYLLRALVVPAERTRLVCERLHHPSGA